MDEFLKSIDGKGSSLRSVDYYSEIAATLKKLGLKSLFFAFTKSKIIRLIKRAHFIAIILRRKEGSACSANSTEVLKALKIDEPTTEPSNMEPNRRQDK